MSEAISSPAFAPTRWTLILRARGETPEARAALSELCESYYQPVLGFLRREGQEEESARELAQEFFTRLLASQGFITVDPARGRFRSYLLGALKHFVADQRKLARRLKRGGGLAVESLDGVDAESDDECRQVADVSAAAPDALFDREWALVVLARALNTLAQDFTTQGRAAHFEMLKPWLMGEDAAQTQAEIARQLKLTEGAVKVLIHRLRKRFRDAVRAEIAQTLRDPAQVDEELRHFISALS